MKRPVYDLLLGIWKSKENDIEEIFSFWQHSNETGIQSNKYTHKTIKSGEIIFESKFGNEFSSGHLGDLNSPFMINCLGHIELRVDRINDKELHLTKMESYNEESRPLVRYVLKKVSSMQ